MAKNAFIITLSRKSSLYIFLLGKIIRNIFMFSFLYFLLTRSNGLLGYNSNQVIFFAATFLLVDTLAQFFFRSVYTFKSLVVSGDFDLILTKPINPLFRSLMGGPDAIDFLTLPLIIAVVIFLGSALHPSIINTVFYIVLVLNGILVGMAFHIIVLSIGIITLEVDHIIMVFRDLSSMGRLPIDIYKEPLKSVLTFLVPVSVMITVPSKVLMGLVSPIGILSTLLFSFVFLVLSLKFWNLALKKYTSASS